MYMKMKWLLLAGIYFFGFGLTLVSARKYIIQPTDKNISERNNNYPGFTQILTALSVFIENLLAFLTGNGSIDDITKAIQDLVTECSRMVSIQGMVGQIPLVRIILQPLVGFMAMVLSHTPLMGGLISFALVGLSP